MAAFVPGTSGPTTAQRRPGTAGTRGLLALVIGLGVLILAGTGLVIATLIHRAIAPSPPRDTISAPQVPLDAPPPGPPPAPAGPPAAIDLGLPAGARIVSVTQAGGRLVLRIEGGGADGLVLLDPRDGHQVATIRTQH